MTTRDPLSAFRRDQPTLSATDPTSGLKIYEAFKSRDRAPERLEIRRVLGVTHAPGYRYLMDMNYNGEKGTELILFYSFIRVEIKGKHLQALIHSIEEGTCVFIQDFHEEEFSPPQPGEAIIEKIEIIKERG